jgi:hypothetical protein
MPTAIVTIAFVLLVGLLWFWTATTISDEDVQGPAATVIVIPATPVPTP